MRDRKFIAEHRGGLLSKSNHFKLISWAVECSEHVISLLDGDLDNRLLFALQVAKEWGSGSAATGDTMKASVASHAAAREYTNPVSIAVARSIGHAVATAHMADHSIGASIYALKAIKLVGRSVEAEREWQDNQLPWELKEMVISERLLKEKS